MQGGYEKGRKSGHGKSSKPAFDVNDPMMIELAEKEQSLLSLQAVRIELERVRLLSDQLRR